MNSKQETHQTVLTITKALTKTTNCTRRAKKVEGRDKTSFSGDLRRTCVPPTYKFVPAPLPTIIIIHHSITVSLTSSKHIVSKRHKLLSEIENKAQLIGLNLCISCINIIPV